MDGTFLVGETGAALGLSPQGSSTAPFSQYDDQAEEGDPSEYSEYETEAPSAPASVAPPPPGVLLAEHSEGSPFRSAKRPQQAPDVQQATETRYSPDPQGSRVADAAFVPRTPLAEAASHVARVAPSHATVLKSPMLASVSRVPPAAEALADDDDDLLGSFGALRDSLRGLMQGRYK